MNPKKDRMLQKMLEKLLDNYSGYSVVLLKNIPYTNQILDLPFAVWITVSNQQTYMYLHQIGRIRTFSAEQFCSLLSSSLFSALSFISHYPLFSFLLLFTLSLYKCFLILRFSITMSTGRNNFHSHLYPLTYNMNKIRHFCSNVL